MALRAGVVRLAGPLALVLAVAACAPVIAGPGPGPYYRGQAAVPPGHMPPPGACRVWFPDRPPGHQPPPGPCRSLRHRVPPGAVLVYGG